MKTELIREDLLKNISATRQKLEEIKKIESQIIEIYTEPVTPFQKKMLTTTINTAWVVVFGVMAYNFVGYHLFLMAVLYWIFRGSVITNRVSKSLFKKQLEENESLIEKLYQQKGEKEYELKTISMLETELHDIGMLKQFEKYLHSKKAITLDKCMDLYVEEN